MLHRFHPRNLTICILLLASFAASAPRADEEASPAPSVAKATKVDVDFSPVERVVVRKAARSMELYRYGEVVRTYKIALGLRPSGPKEVEGDYRTPEGRYTLERRNAQSDYFLSIQVSYPNAADIARAKKVGANPGSAIMVHGLPNTPTKSMNYYSRMDWTDGCIAVNNSDMVEIWLMTAPGTPIEILP